VEAGVHTQQSGVVFSVLHLLTKSEFDGFRNGNIYSVVTGVSHFFQRTKGYTER
jgi:hypothetical protein